MIDMETKSLWGQLLGTAYKGPLKGQSLKIIPSLMTDWKSWRQQHPDTTVLWMSRTSKQFVRDIYANPSYWVVGLVEQGQPRAWPLAGLTKQPIVNDAIGRTPVLLVFDPNSATTYAYRRSVNDQVLVLTKKDGRLVDQQTGTSWDPASGMALSGKMKDKRLEPLPIILSFREPWQFFHPNSSYWLPR